MTALLPARVYARAVDGALLTAVGLGWGYPLNYGLGWLVGHAALVYLYFAGGDALAGRTPGKALFRLQVQAPGGGRPSWRQSLAREAFVLLGAVPYLGPLLALGSWGVIIATIRSSASGEGLHDRMAGDTRVVRVSAD